MPQRWCIWLTIEGDLRFCSHHEMMRVVERAAARAAVPLKFTEGFNPHPIYSFLCPRPTGVASNDLLVIRLDPAAEDTPDDDLLAALNRTAPAGLRFTRAEALAPSQKPRAVRMHYELPLSADRAEAMRQRLRDCQTQETWPVARKSLGRSPKKPTSVDLRPLIERISIEGNTLRWIGRPQANRWARPGEVLSLLGLGERIDLAEVRRTAIEYELDPADNSNTNESSAAAG